MRGKDGRFCTKAEQRMAFVGRSYSYEVYYQDVGRCWRFGQKRNVTVDLIVAEGEDLNNRLLSRGAVVKEPKS